MASAVLGGGKGSATHVSKRVSDLAEQLSKALEKEVDSGLEDRLSHNRQYQHLEKQLKAIQSGLWDSRLMLSRQRNSIRIRLKQLVEIRKKRVKFEHEVVDGELKEAAVVEQMQKIRQQVRDEMIRDLAPALPLPISTVTPPAPAD